MPMSGSVLGPIIAAHFTSKPGMTAAEKQQIVADWTLIATDFITHIQTMGVVTVNNVVPGACNLTGPGSHPPVVSTGVIV